MEQSEESRLKPNFGLDFLEAGIEAGGVRAGAGRLGVYEIAALSIHARTFSKEDSTFLCFVPAIWLLIFLEFM